MRGQCAVSDGKSLGALVVGWCSCLVKTGDGGGRRVPVAWVIMGQLAWADLKQTMAFFI
jgi:hypothetical protein